MSSPLALHPSVGQMKPMQFTLGELSLGMGVHAVRYVNSQGNAACRREIVT